MQGTSAQAPGRTAARLLRTRDVLERTGITHQVLYRYVTLGLIEPAGTTEGGQRLFHPRVVDLIREIRGLIDTGYSLRHLKEIFFREERVRRACGAPQVETGRGEGDRSSAGATA